MEEKLADYAHSVWSHWMLHLFSICKEVSNDDDLVTFSMPKQFYDRWKRQMNTPYSELSEAEKESDRVQAACIMQLLVESNEVP